MPYPSSDIAYSTLSVNKLLVMLIGRKVLKVWSTSKTPPRVVSLAFEEHSLMRLAH